MSEGDDGGGGGLPELAHEPDWQLPPLEFGLTADDAECLKAQAAVYRASALEPGPPMARAESLARAVALDAIADQASDGVGPVRRGVGGEIMVKFPADASWHNQQVGRATTDHPALIAAEASVDRLKLARDAGFLSMAVDVAERHGATSPAEQILAHQIASSHTLAMKLAAKSQAFLSREFLPYKDPFRENSEAQREQVASIEASRCATASAKLMEATARAALALDRLRNGSRQTIVVQQKVEVQSGGQAVVAGTMAVGRKKRRNR